MEDSKNIQKKEYILTAFYNLLNTEFSKEIKKLNFSSLFSQYLKDYKEILDNNHNVCERYQDLSDLYGIYSNLPSKLEKLYQIFRTLSNKVTYYRFFHVLKIMHQNGDKYLTKNEIEDQVKHIFGSEIKRLSVDLRKLRINGIIKRRGIRYHLTDSGATIFNSILKLEKDLEPDLIEKLSRAILMHSIYEGKGLDIKTYQHVQQLGFLLQEIIEQAINRGEVLEWVNLLDKIDQIIKDLDIITEKYDEPAIKQILLKTKSKIAHEFSRYHEVTDLAIKQNLSLIDKGIYPKRMKQIMNLFNLKNWYELENIFSNDCISSFLPILNEEFLGFFKENEENNDDYNEISLSNSIGTEIVDKEELNRILDFIIPYNKAFANKFLNSPEKTGVFLSQLINKWELGWKESSLLVGNLPSISGKYPIECGILTNISKLEKMTLKEGFLFSAKGVKNEN